MGCFFGRGEETDSNGFKIFECESYIKIPSKMGHQKQKALCLPATMFYDTTIYRLWDSDRRIICYVMAILTLMKESNREMTIKHNNSV